MPGSALILGATGRFGHNATHAFQAAGWTVTPFRRGRDNLAAMAKQADIVVNGWNPAYTDWARTVPGLTEDIITALRGTEATVILPGNVYVFGAQTPGPWGPDTPHQAQNPLGKIRREMERRYRQSGLRTIVLRGGDYIDTRASGNWLDQIMLKSLAKGVFTYPGTLDIPHAWAYLPDIARAGVDLAEQRAALPAFCDVSFPGYTLTGQQIAAELSTITGTPLRARRMSWWPIRALSPVWPMGRAVQEMRYLWDTPHMLDGTRFDALLPGFEHTPVQQALARAVQGVGGTVTSTQTNRWRLADSAAS